MTEIAAILQAFSELSPGSSAVLATVARVQGSAYRGAGARALVLPNGRTVGMVSGGCLESDLKLRAEQLTASSEPVLVRYDNTADDEIVWQLGLGCKGVVDVLLERVNAGELPAFLDVLWLNVQDRRPLVLARVLGGDGLPVGACLALDENGVLLDDIGPGNGELDRLIRLDALAALAERHSRVAVYETAAGRAEIFLELLPPPPSLLVCGAGPDAVPLVRLAKEVGWHVEVVDPRAVYASRERFPLADEVVVAAPEDFDLNGNLPDRAAAVLMTHNYDTDRRFLRVLMDAPLCYIGVLGPRNRTEALLIDLAADGVIVTDQHKQRLYAPVGFDLGAETPQEIALAIVAEIQAVFAGRSGHSLRISDRPIHDRSAQIHLSPVPFAKPPGVCLMEVD